MIAGNRCLPHRKLLAQISADRCNALRRALRRWREQHRLDEALQAGGEILIGLAHHAPLDRALVQVGGEEARLAWPALLDIFDNRGALE